MNELSFLEQLSRVLNTQIKLSDDLLALAKQEYDILSSNDVSSLASIAEQKKPIIADLENLTQAWFVVLKNKGVELSGDGINQFLREIDVASNSQLLTTWQLLQEKAIECQQKNTINGSVIAMRQQTTQKTINLLRGFNSEHHSYDHFGNESNTYSGGNSLAKA